jgi:hypothetical protein
VKTLVPQDFQAAKRPILNWKHYNQVDELDVGVNQVDELIEAPGAAS